MQNRERWSAAAPTMSGYPISIPAYLVLDVDAAPGIFPAPVHLASALVSDRHVGPNNCEGHPLPHPVVLRIHLGDGEVVDLDLVLLQLQQDLKYQSVSQWI